MVFIYINGVYVKLGSALPDTISSLTVETQPGILILANQIPLLKQWLNDIADRLTCEYVSYNGTLVPVSEIHKF